MSQSKMVIWGASGHARVVADVVSQLEEYELVGFLDSLHPDRRGAAFSLSTVLGGEERLPELMRTGVEYCLVAIGDCSSRVQIAAKAVDHGLQLATAVHPRAVVASDSSLGPGTVVMAGAVVNSGTAVGPNSIVNTGATVDHDCTLAEGVHISPGAHLAGNVKIGAGTWIGIGAVVSDRVNIGPHSIVGAGSLVLDDLPSNVIAWGSPARARKQNPAAVAHR